MNKKILAVSMTAVLAISLLATVSPFTAEANHRGSSSGNPTSRIIDNLQQINSGLFIVQNGVDFIREDLKIKKKFYEVTFDGKAQGIQGGKGNFITLVEEGCPGALPTELRQEEDGTIPCAFNVESLIVGAFHSGNPECIVDHIVVDGVRSDLATPIDVTNRLVNILLEAGIMQLGASDTVQVDVDCFNTADVFVEFDGERPQISHFDITHEFGDNHGSSPP